MFLVLLMHVDLHISYIAVRHRIRHGLSKSASSTYLDARNRSATRVGTKKLFVLCSCSGDHVDFLNLTRAADEPQTCSAANERKSREALVLNM
eukprot:6977480-Pyramimonas_sp.AAC.1